MASKFDVGQILQNGQAELGNEIQHAVTKQAIYLVAFFARNSLPGA